jgi:hypothetical protein
MMPLVVHRCHEGVHLTASPTQSASKDGERTVLRPPAWARYFSLFGTVVVGAVAVWILIIAIFLLFHRWWWFGALTAAMACFMAGLTGYVARDLRGKWGLRVELLPDRMVLDLPSGRSLIHRPPGQHLTIPYSDVEGVETRLEAYPSLGMEIMQRAYVLSRRQGDHIFLFEDRALGTMFESPMVAKIASAIVARANVPLRDLGMVEGRGGFLAVWGTHAPDWAAPSLTLAQQLRIWRHAAVTGSLAFTIIVIALSIKMMVG